MTTLITVDELAAALGQRSGVRILDVRWSLEGPPGLPLYRDGHIPAAVYVDLERDLAAPASSALGRHPLPDVGDLQAAARRWGINSGDQVVVYDDLGNLSAARAWWLLRHAGLGDVRLLDGALAAWRQAGLPLESGDTVPSPGTIELEYAHLPVLSTEDAALLPERGVLIDARSPERYRGDVEPIDPRAGHIPGAANAPATANVGPDGRFLPSGVLADRYESLGVSASSEVGVYCGSGVTAAHDVAALTIAGFTAALYPGSWSQWSNDPGRDVATGSQ